MEGSPIASDACGKGDLRLLVVTLNAGKHRLDPQMLRHALNDVLCNASRKAEIYPDSVAAVVLALQESDSEAESSWEEAMNHVGFPKRVAGLFLAEASSQVAVHARPEEHGTAVVVEADGAPFTTKAVAADPREGAPKGAAAARLCVQPGNWMLCVGSAHLDGKMANEEERVAQLPAAVLRASNAVDKTDVGACLDAVLLAGDVNFTLRPRNSTQTDTTAFLVAKEMAAVSELPAFDAIQPLSQEAKVALMRALSVSDERAMLQTLDGCPELITINADALQHDANFVGDMDSLGDDHRGYLKELRLAPMPQGSFPTYRICSAAHAGLQHDCASAFVTDGVWRIAPSLELSPECISSCYFADKKAGALKKRGSVTRLQMGWLDRMYTGCMPDVTLEVHQADPLLLVAPSGIALDHLLVSWVVILRRQAPLNEKRAAKNATCLFC